jgi:hypothetical protein
LSYDDKNELGRSGLERDLRGTTTSTQPARATGKGPMMAALIGLVALLAVVFLVWRGYDASSRDTELNTTGTTSSPAPAGSGAGSGQAMSPTPGPRPTTPPAPILAPAPANPAPATPPAPAQ